MESRTFLDGLNASEIEVEYSVRGLTSTDPTSAIQLNNELIKEQSNKDIRPKIPHITNLPEIEIETCREKATELNLLSDRLGLHPSIDNSWKLFTRAKHWRDRAERILLTFGNILDINSVVSSLRRLINWHIKCINDAREAEQSRRGAQPSFTPTLNSSPNTTADKEVIRDHQNVSTSNATGAGASYIPPVASSGAIPKTLNMGQQNLLNTIFPPNPNLNTLLSQSQLLGQNSSVPMPHNNVRENQFRLLNQFEPPNVNNINFDNIIQPPNQNLGVERGVVNPQVYERRYFGSDVKLRQKWNTTYDGSSSKNVRDFIYRLETLATDDGYPLENLTKILHMFLLDKASDWFWVFKQNHPATTWVQMRSGIINYFSSYDSEDETKEQIIRRFQGSKESFSDFSLEIQKLNGRLSNRLSEREILQRLFHNMHPALRNATLGYQMQINSIESLRILCSRFEQLWFQTGFDPKKNYDPQVRRRPAISEMQSEILSIGSQQDLNSNFGVPIQACCSCLGTNLGNKTVNQETSTEQGVSSCVEISEVLEQNKVKILNRSDYVICWNCLDMGHIFLECAKPIQHQFCFGCGEKNVIKPNCVKCQKKKIQGNLPSGVFQRGQSRPSQLPISNPNSSQADQHVSTK